jgi:lipopolysaccharide assembly outer membrane protein LptD (OstA)
LIFDHGSLKVRACFLGADPVSLHRLLAMVALCLLMTHAGHSPALAQGSMLEISMEELVDDTWRNRIVARGNVEIRFYGEILVADEVAYDRGTRKLIAEGNVALTEADGKTSRSSRLTLNDELRDAFLAYVRRQRIRVDR